MTALQEVMAGLADRDLGRRLEAIANLGDLLRGRALDQASAETAVRRLVDEFVSDSRFDVREASLNAIAGAFDHHEFSLGVVEPLRPSLPSMGQALLDYALYIFAATHDPAARADIEPFLGNSDPEIREIALDALDELPGRR